MSNNLTWEEVEVQFVNLVKFAAKNTYVNQMDVDKSIGADDLFQIGMVKLFVCWKRYSHLPLNEFKAVFSTALFREVRENCKSNYDTDLETAMLIVESPSVNNDDKGVMAEIETLKRYLKNDVAVAILSELVNPSPKTLWLGWAERARKSCVKSQGKKVNVAHDNNVKMRHIRDALEITQKQFDIAMREIREKAHQFIGEGGVFA